VLGREAGGLEGVPEGVGGVVMAPLWVHTERGADRRELIRSVGDGAVHAMGEVPLDGFLKWSGREPVEGRHAGRHSVGFAG